MWEDINVLRLQDIDRIQLSWSWFDCVNCLLFLQDNKNDNNDDDIIHAIIIHQTHYEKSDWSRAFNQFTIACELDMINVISAADITFIMSSSMSACLLSPLECSPQKQNGWTLRFCFWGWIMWKMYNKTITEFGFHMISWIIKPLCLCYHKTSDLIIHDIMLNLIQ